MMNARENYLAAARGGMPERVPVFPVDCNVFRPGFWKERDPETGVDFCNIKWVKNDMGEMPLPGRKAMEDIGRWKETVRFPELSKLDWAGMAKEFEEGRDPEKVNIAMLNTAGWFLIPVNMLGWEDALCAIYEEPEEMEAFVSAITDFLLELADYIGKYIKPDIVFTGDDFAAANGPFISRSVFQAMYKPYITKVVDKIHSIGALVEFHCCGNCQFLIQEFLETGADSCQLPEPNEQLLTDKERYGKRLVLTGGWDRHGPGCMPFASEEVVRESVRTAIDVYGKDGALIFWDGGICGTSEDSENKRKWVMDEALRYGSRVYRGKRRRDENA